MEETGEPRAKLLYLESLRGVAALVVVFSHFAEAFFPAAVRDPTAPIHSVLDSAFYTTPLGVLLGGNFSVCLFFVMSGFVLARPFFSSRKYELLANATVRRYFRLMPPVAVSVLIAYGLLAAGMFTNQALVPTTGSEWLAARWAFAPDLSQAAHQAFVGAFIGDQPVNYNPLLWTMQIEFLGSLLIFGLAALMAGRQRRWLVYAVLMILLARTYYLGFLFGLILADYAAMERKGPSWLAQVPKRYIVGLLSVGLILGGYPSSGSAAGTWYEVLTLPLLTGFESMALWHTLGALGVVVAVFYLPAVKRFLSLKWLVWLGKLSFSLYLTHMIILCTFGTYVFARLHEHLGYLTSFAGSLSASLLVIFSVSAIYTALVDGPAIRWAKRVGKWILAPVNVPAPEPAVAVAANPTPQGAGETVEQPDPASQLPPRQALAKMDPLTPWLPDSPSKRNVP